MAKLSKEFQKVRSLLIAYRGVFKSEEGQRVLNDLMKNNHVFIGTFDKDPMTMAFREGQRSVIMDILDKLQIEPEEYARIYENQHNESDTQLNHF